MGGETSLQTARASSSSDFVASEHKLLRAGCIGISAYICFVFGEIGGAVGCVLLLGSVMRMSLPAV
jgi:hypothetical protein